jgi:iron-sulfur cluster assembly protein/iron-sulfur cluster insertion protein
MFTLTESAATKVRSLLAAEDDAALCLRVAVRPGGCSGFSYEMYFDAEQSEADTRLTLHDVAVLIDQSSAVLLDAATLDYRDGLTDAGFKIDNRAASRTCGCGQSFS